MSAAAEILYDTSPGFHFKPFDDELIELYLLPRVRGQPDLFPGLIVDDDAAANTQPWELFDRHGRSYAVPAFFFVRTNGAARPDRRCQGGGTWKSMKCEREDASHEMVVDGEKIKWSRHNLNLHMVPGKKSGGSNGWVMHEYSITTHPSIKICRISFSGFGQKRKRVPDGYQDDEPVTQRPRVACASATSGSGMMTFDQGFSAAPHDSGDRELLHDSSDAAMLAEMTNWEFQAEQVQAMNTSAPDQEPPPSFSTTTTPSQESGLTQDGAGLEPLELLSDDDITEVLGLVAEPPAMDQSSCGVPSIGDTDVAAEEGGSATSGSGTTTMLSQESGLPQEEEGLEPLELLSEDGIAEVLDMIAPPPAMDQSSYGVPNIGDTDIVHWEGIDFDLSFV